VQILSSITRAVDTKDWLITANLIFSALLLLWILRYRILYHLAETQRLRSNDTIENLSEGFYRSSLDGRPFRANRSLVRLNGYESEAEMLAGIGDMAKEWYVDPSRYAEFCRRLHEGGKVADFMSEVYRHKTRERIWVAESARLVRDEATGHPAYFEGSVRDVTAEVERLELEARLETLTQHVPGGLFQFVCRPDGPFALPFASEGFRQILSTISDDLVADPMRFVEYVHPDDVEVFCDTLVQSGKTLRAWFLEFRVSAASAGLVWLSVSATPEAAEDGSITWHGHLLDISERKHSEDRIHQLAYFDPLTELPNRRLLIDRLEQVLANCSRRGEYAAVLFADMDGFKSLNDTQGHELGDQLLVEAARRLRGDLRRNDTVARFGGDEFVIILENLGASVAEAQARAAMVARKTVEAFRAPFRLGAIQHTATLSVGVIVFNGDGDKTEELLKSADIAMYEAKVNGRDGFEMFDPVSRKRVADTYALQSDLRGACERGEMRLMFQPQVDARGLVKGVEALLRWDHPILGTVMPGSFIPLAEQSGLIDAIDDWVLAEGVRTLARWSESPQLREMALSLNVSAKHFRKPSFPEEVGELICRHGIEPSRLILELTEHAVASNREELQRRMLAIKAYGVRFSLDDFGTGYSSLSFLKNLPLDEVKIDGSFIAGIANERADREFVRMILALARTLGLSTVAERVENAFQESFLIECGCDLFQGFHHSGPISGIELEAFVRERETRAERRTARTA
jgi:diguanylate cyclase (GGDEF)-like protein/PAS domain S-box-containing protein